MKVLFVTYPWIGLRQGGLQVQMASSRAALISRGVQVDLFDPFHLPLAEYDVVHVFSLLPANWPIVEAANSANVKVVTSSVFNGFSFSPRAARWAYRLSRSKAMLGDFRVAGLIIRGSDRVIALTEQESSLVSRTFGVPVAPAVIPNGVSSVFLESETSARRDDSYVLSVASINPNKNQLSLIRACVQMQWPLKLVGDVTPGCESYMARCIKAASSGPVEFCGPVPAASVEMVDLYLGASVFALPSFSEVLPIAALEAYSLGLPLVLPTGGALIDFLPPGAGIAYCSPDEASISRALKTVLRAEQRAWPISRDELGWGEVATRLESIYASALAEWSD